MTDPVAQPSGLTTDAAASAAHSHPYDRLDPAELRSRASAKWQTYGPDVLPLWVAEMDYPLAEPIRARLASMVERGDTGYVVPEAMLEAYVGDAQRRFGSAPDTSGGLVIADVMRGVELALRELTGPGSAVAFLTPAYHPFYPMVQWVGRRVAGIPLARAAEPGARYELDLDRVAQTLARPDVSAFLFCNPHNPTGRVFTADEVRSVAEIARRHGVLVIVDEVHAAVTFPEVAHTPWWSLPEDVRAPSVVLVSGSKAWNLAGLKAALAFGYGTAPRQMLRALPGTIQLEASILGAAANVAAFTEGDPWLRDTLDYLDGNRKLLADLLAERLPQIGYTPPEATYLAWLDCRELGWGDDPAERFHTHGRVAVNSGPDFGAEGAGHVRLNLATSRTILTEAVERMRAAVASAADA